MKKSNVKKRLVKKAPLLRKKSTVIKKRPQKKAQKKAPNKKSLRGKLNTGPKRTALNPFLQKWKTPFEIPPFSAIKVTHFLPAFEKSMQIQDKEIAAIRDNQALPTFANTIEAMENTGESLDKVSAVFSNLTSSDSSEALQKIERVIAPRLAAHESKIYMDAKLFQRVDQIFQDRKKLKLEGEKIRLLEETHRQFVRAGACLSVQAKKRMAEIVERTATLGTQFSQNILADEQAFRLVLEGERELSGLPDFVRAAAARTGEELAMPGKFVITLARASIEPFLQFSERRDLRERAYGAWTKRGENGNENDNRAIAVETIKLRNEQAKLLGFKNFAEFRLEDTMAKKPSVVRDLLEEVWSVASKKATEERDRLETFARREGHNIQVEAWDWWHYSEKVRKAEFNLEESEVKPFLQLDKMIEAAFDTARRLFGITFEERTDLPKYHPEVRTFEVKDQKGKHLGIFMGDYFARSSKSSGAWMSTFRGQRNFGRKERPVVINVMSFARGAAGTPVLISFDGARTLFHELGHGLHALLSDVNYPSLSCTEVATDFVELPSQLFEHWLSEPVVLKQFAQHYKTGKPIPDHLLKRIGASRNFNNGFATVEYVSSALADLELHLLEDPQNLDLGKFERDLLQRKGMPRAISMRHRLPHFAHIFSSDGYASGYYSYLWSEVMDADAFAAFGETGDVFHSETAQRLKEFIYSAGNSRDPEEAYKKFRGRLPTSQAMMKKRGLI